MDMKQAIDAISRFKDLSREEMHDVMHLIMTGQSTPAQMAGFLVGLRMKGETVEEITAAAEVMRNLATPINIESEQLVDIVGTGGDGANLFNVSTCTSLVVAAAGGKVAKHGNRSVSSSSGSADLLDFAGVNLNLTPDQVARCVNEMGVGFMFAPQFHTAMRHAVAVRGDLGIRTIFNTLGPLTNPAGAKHQLLGVYTAKLVKPLAKVLGNLGLTHALVVSSDDGLDEISIAAPTHVAEYRNGRVIEYVIKPEDFGLQPHSLDPLRVNSSEESFNLVKQVLNNEPGVARDMVLLNAGAALFAADVAESIIEGVAMAQDALASGQAAEKLKVLVNFTQSLA
ncbi:anthranilate phosphoribosyltransferase [Marinospirillum insulare]|uniref:Anthranilate phosphoribosyltransferase n=1 Tax=Marinospirillum insulare TaxID=217169 RepID=A0ABQ5ZUM2_9GAMM|nr:anthranilate phosphoribosyltransferase [Marinospirillum insulare]GLR62728.1 anthranilate phosphoribosyltransferase [Marinospirillum insulare]